MKPKPAECEQCGHEVDLDDDVSLVDDLWLCSYCIEDIERDHPNMEKMIAEAEWREER